jgi:hypothetical protein
MSRKSESANGTNLGPVGAATAVLEKAPDGQRISKNKSTAAPGRKKEKPGVPKPPHWRQPHAVGEKRDSSARGRGRQTPSPDRLPAQSKPVTGRPLPEPTASDTRGAAADSVRSARAAMVEASNKRAMVEAMNERAIDPNISADREIMALARQEAYTIRNVVYPRSLLAATDLGGSISILGIRTHFHDFRIKTIGDSDDRVASAMVDAIAQMQLQLAKMNERAVETHDINKVQIYMRIAHNLTDAIGKTALRLAEYVSLMSLGGPRSSQRTEPGKDDADART